MVNGNCRWEPTDSSQELIIEFIGQERRRKFPEPLLDYAADDMHLIIIKADVTDVCRRTAR